MKNLLFLSTCFTPPITQVLPLEVDETAALKAEAMGVADGDWAELDCAKWLGHEQWSTCFLIDAGAISFDLAAAQRQGEMVAKSESAQIQQELTDGYTIEQIAAQTTVPVDSRDARMQSVIDALNEETSRLMAQLDAITAATTVDELNAAVYPEPTTTLEAA